MADDKTAEDYRELFGSAKGKSVLANMLMEAGFFDDDLKTTEQLAVENFVKGILKKIGIYRDPTTATFFVRKLLETPINGNK